jgi:molybdopterin synthase catalytic subunit
VKIELLAFASAGDALGSHSLELELPDGSRVADLKEQLLTDHPALAPVWPRLAVAVDGELATPESELAEGSEVALLPPVSGGTPERRRTALTDGPIDLPGLLAAVSARGRGAVLLFLGTVRDQHQGRPVAALTYTAYRPMAEARLERIARQLADGEAGLEVAIVHRLGRLEPGEASVAIVTASPHRAAAYQASRTALERLKAEVPIWKQEHYADGESAWREEESLRPAGDHRRTVEVVSGRSRP